MVKEVARALQKPAMLWQIPGGHMPTVAEGPVKLRRRILRQVVLSSWGFADWQRYQRHYPNAAKYRDEQHDLWRRDGG